MVDSIMVVGALTLRGLLHSMWDLKAAHMNAQRTLIREVMFYEFELSHNTSKVKKYICCAKSEVEFDYWHYSLKRGKTPLKKKVTLYNSLLYP